MSIPDAKEWRQRGVIADEKDYEKLMRRVESALHNSDGRHCVVRAQCASHQVLSRIVAVLRDKGYHVDFDASNGELTIS